MFSWSQHIPTLFHCSISCVELLERTERLEPITNIGTGKNFKQKTFIQENFHAENIQAEDFQAGKVTTQKSKKQEN